MANIPIDLSPSDAIETITNLTTVLPPELITSITGLIMLFKAIGIFLLIYIIVLIIGTIMNIKRYYMIKKILKLTEEMHNKINRKSKDKD